MGLGVAVGWGAGVAVGKGTPPDTVHVMVTPPAEKPVREIPEAEPS